LVSAFVSLTITPVLNVLLSRKNAKHSWFYNKTEPFFYNLESGYKSLLQRFIDKRWMAWAIVFICLLIVAVLGKTLQSELAPLEDKNQMRLMMTGPEGASFQYMINATEEVQNYLIDSVPERDFTFFSVPGLEYRSKCRNGQAWISAKSERERSQSTIALELTKKIPQFNNVRIFPLKNRLFQSDWLQEERFQSSLSYKP